MDTAPKKNTKWIIFGSVVIVFALLIAVGPVLLTKYMRAKWEDTPKYRTSYLLMSVEGKLLLSEDNVPYLLGDNLYYLLENLSEEDINKYLDKECFVLGKIVSPEPEEKIDGNDVRMILSVDEIRDIDSPDTNEIVDENTEENYYKNLEEKAAKKNKLALETNIALNKPIMFDVIKGKLSLQNRKNKNGEEVSVVILTDEFGDNYLLRRKDKPLTDIVSIDEVICLGREALPLKDMFLVVDEINFEIHEMYDSNLKKIL